MGSSSDFFWLFHLVDDELISFPGKIHRYLVVDKDAPVLSEKICFMNRPETTCIVQISFHPDVMRKKPEFSEAYKKIIYFRPCGQIFIRIFMYYVFHNFFLKVKTEIPFDIIVMPSNNRKLPEKTK